MLLFPSRIRQLLFFTFLTRMTTSSSSSHSNVIIIGGGAAGLTSALEVSSSEEVEVYLLEKMSKVGGNSAKASSG